MHRLRIEFRGKGKHLLARDMARSVRAETAGREVFKGQRHDGDFAEDCRRASPIVAVLCSNLKPRHRMGRLRSCSGRGSALGPVALWRRVMIQFRFAWENTDV